MADILLSAFVLSVVLLGIHSFFGLEIIKRGIIFTDLELKEAKVIGRPARQEGLGDRW